MSRIGNKPIPVPDGVKVDIKGAQIRVTGKQGEIQQALPPGIQARVEDGVLLMERPDDQPRSRAFHGLARALVANCIKGVSEKFEKKLEIVGIGYRATLEGKKLSLNVGFSHPVEFALPDGIEVEVEKQTIVTVRGIDKQQVGQVAAEIRDTRRPDMYKGKGVRYLGERVRQKVGKSGGK